MECLLLLPPSLPPSGFDKVMRSIDQAVEAGLDHVKVRVVCSGALCPYDLSHLAGELCGDERVK